MLPKHENASGKAKKVLPKPENAQSETTGVLPKVGNAQSEVSGVLSFNAHCDDYTTECFSCIAKSSKSAEIFRRRSSALNS